jgi:hypothetical protein
MTTSKSVWRSLAVLGIAVCILLSRCGSEGSALQPTATPPPDSLTLSQPQQSDLGQPPIPTMRERVFPTPLPTMVYAAQPEANFGIRFEYGCLTPTRVLDTFTQTLTQLAGDGTHPVTVTLVLRPDTLQTIYEEVAAINFLSYPPEFSIPLEPNELVGSGAPYSVYRLYVRNGSSTADVHWKDEISSPTSDEAEQLRHFLRHIEAIIDQHPEVSTLPPLPGCA